MHLYIYVAVYTHVHTCIAIYTCTCVYVYHGLARHSCIYTASQAGLPDEDAGGAAPPCALPARQNSSLALGTPSSPSLSHEEEELCNVLRRAYATLVVQLSGEEVPESRRGVFVSNLAHDIGRHVNCLPREGPLAASGISARFREVGSDSQYAYL